MKRALLFAGLTFVAGCGIREPLRPAEGARMPGAPALAARSLTSDELLQTTTEQRPLRVDEPLTRSERRPVDRFSLPPPDATGEAPANGAAASDEVPQPTDAPPPQQTTQPR